LTSVALTSPEPSTVKSGAIVSVVALVLTWLSFPLPPRKNEPPPETVVLALNWMNALPAELESLRMMVEVQLSAPEL
jgi:hypothetical protein